ncbi:MAG: aminotransferase class V-fold PLP-dependent enzyme [Clostridiales bacterium]|nr:aminotransferase class V-fold PLP-dependent enzyme [Clostridiales bacterium]
MIYLDNAATTQKKPECVVQAVVWAMGSLGNCGRGANDGALSAARVVYSAREALAKMFGLNCPERVCFTANSTEALNIAIRGLLGPKDHVITTDLEHNSVLRPLYGLVKKGMEISFLKADKNGRVDVEKIPGMIRENTKCIICTHASNLTGNVLDIHRIGEIAKSRGLLFILDASQTAGSFPIHMEKDNISVLCFTGHKGLMGPQGTGGLCVAKGVEIEPHKSGGTGVQTYLREQPREYPTRLEAGTLNSHGIAGLLAALKYIEETGIDTIHQKESALMERFYAGVRNIPGVTVYGDFSKPMERAPIVTLNIGGWDCGEVEDILSGQFDIAVRSGGHCAPRMHEALGTRETGAVRFSFGWFNTEGEIDIAVEAVKKIAQE